MNISMNSQLPFLALISLQAPHRFPGKTEPGAANSWRRRWVQAKRLLCTLGICAICFQKRGKVPWLQKKKKKKAESPVNYSLLKEDRKHRNKCCLLTKPSRDRTHGDHFGRQEKLDLYRSSSSLPGSSMVFT